MTKHCVTRMDGPRQRFFTGRFANTRRTAQLLPLPKTTGRHDKAQAYDDRHVARLVCDYLNTIASITIRLKPWAVLPLPEARK
ncbi:hypothetical protein [Bradyrhizobium japonicum]|uniref:hypothetical protein n=1 Tax=Bradyrhizobium japonicum TaxID=375 RepID=UPI001BACB1D2|nr:hypothetical protein [Bradyrhizobium japonicum]MBR0962225.1 hypothetical protein [Bradyrhizobium japonicum]